MIEFLWELLVFIFSEVGGSTLGLMGNICSFIETRVTTRPPTPRPAFEEAARRNPRFVCQQQMRD